MINWMDEYLKCRLSLPSGVVTPSKMIGDNVMITLLAKDLFFC